MDIVTLKNGHRYSGKILSNKNIYIEFYDEKTARKMMIYSHDISVIELGE